MSQKLTINTIPQNQSKFPAKPKNSHNCFAWFSTYSILKYFPATAKLQIESLNFFYQNLSIPFPYSKLHPPKICKQSFSVFFNSPFPKSSQVYKNPLYQQLALFLSQFSTSTIFPSLKPLNKTPNQFYKLHAKSPILEPGLLQHLLKNFLP